MRITMSHFAFLSLPRPLNTAFQPKSFKLLTESNDISMGQVKARRVKESAIEQSIARAIELYKSDKRCTIPQAAESEGLAYSTLYSWLKGRRSRKKAYEVYQTLGEVEERAIVK